MAIIRVGCCQSSIRQTIARRSHGSSEGERVCPTPIPIILLYAHRKRMQINYVPCRTHCFRKAGIASNISTRARDGPVTSGGASILSLFHYQGTSLIAAMVEHVVRRTPAGIQIIMCIEDLVLDIGYYGRLWDMPFATYSKYVSQHLWIYAICSKYAYDHGIEINFDHAVFSPQ